MHPHSDPYLERTIEAIGLNNTCELEAFQRFIDAIPCALSIKLPDHRFLVCNRIDFKTLKKEAPELESPIDIRGKRDRDLFGGGYEVFEEEENRVLRGETILHDYQHRNGLHTRVTKTPLRHPDGCIAGLINTSHVFRVPDPESEVIARQAHRLEAIGQLSSGLAHELNTPIQYIGDNLSFFETCLSDVNALIMACRKMIEASKDPSQKDAALIELEKTVNTLDLNPFAEELPSAIEESVMGIRRISTIVANLRDFSRPAETHRREINLNPCLESVVNIARGEWLPVAEVSLELSNTIPSIHGHISELNQAFLNLLLNAIQAIEDPSRPFNPGKIKIKSAPYCDGVMVSIEDNGIGINPLELHRIFDPFYTTKPVGKGLGQGLSIVHSVVVDRHQGRIRIEPHPEGGTLVRVWLPGVHTHGPMQDPFEMPLP
jgi:signal transduction histidine kinase